MPFAAGEQIAVEESQYNNIEGGEQIALHSAMFSGQLLGVLNSDNGQSQSMHLELGA